MVFIVSNFLFAACFTFLASYFGNLIHGWADIWIIPLLYIAFLLAFIAFTFVIVFASAIPLKPKGDRRDKPSEYSWFFMDNTLKFLSFWSWAIVKTEGFEKIPKDGRYVIYSNHKSNFDAICLYAKLRNQRIAFIAKRSLFKMPLIGKHLYGCGFIPIDRDNLRQAVEVIRNGEYYLTNDLMNVGVYPEGTRNKTDEPLLEIKSGSFKIPMRAKCPIVIIITKNCEYIAKRFPFRPTHVYIKVAEVLKYEDYKDMTTNELQEYVTKKMLESIEELKNYKA